MKYEPTELTMIFLLIHSVLAFSLLFRFFLRR